MKWTRKFSLLIAACWLCAAGSAWTRPADPNDWPTFGWNSARTSAPGTSMGVTAADLASFRRQRVEIDGTVDAAPIYLHGVEVAGATHDVFFLTTTYGKTLAIDADSGHTLWAYTPPAYERIAGSYRITNSTPVAGPDRRYLYAAAPDGMIRKLAVADGRVAWQTAISMLPRREKITAPLSYSQGRIIALTGGYIGDAPPYQGHVAVLDAHSGKLLHVWNALCSGRRQLLDPSSCPESGAAIWGRAGAVIDPDTGNLYVATGDGRWDGRRYWGDAVIELDPTGARMLGNFTPQDTDALDRSDTDLGSTSPALLGTGLVAQGGKDALIRVLAWQRMRGSTPHRGGASAHVSTPSGGRLFTALAVWHRGPETWLFAADGGGTAAWRVESGNLREQWHNEHAGTSPVVADGLLYAYDPGGGLRIYDADTGRERITLPCGRGHWNSPIVVDGRVALPEGNANDHRTSGVFDIWRSPP